jgi:CheY-like chemotaxis protein
LRFKIIELIELYQIRVPKVIVMLSDINLGFADGPNMQKLLETVVRASQAKPRNIRILTRDGFARQFIEGQKEYSDIEVVTNLQYAVDGLLSEIARDDSGQQKAEIIGDKVLAADTAAGGEAMALKFQAEGKGPGFESLKESLQNLRIAAVDDDIIIQELIKNTFAASGAVVKTYSDGSEFLATLDTETFDLAFLDLMMPKVDGFAVLQALQARDIRYPVIVLSAITQRETVIRAFQMGIKSYLVKPLKPADIFKKSMEILKVNF